MEPSCILLLPAAQMLLLNQGVCPVRFLCPVEPPGAEESARVIPKEVLTAKGQRLAPALSRQKCSLFLQLAAEGSTQSSASLLLQHHTHTHNTLMYNTPTFTHQFLGFINGVFYIGEAETGECNKLADHRHELISYLLWTISLVFQLLYVINTSETCTYRQVNRDPGKQMWTKVFLVDNKRQAVQLISAYTFHIFQATAQVVDLLFQLGHTIYVQKKKKNAQG